MSIEIRHLSKTFPNGFHAVDDVSFKMETGSLVAVLGPSGSGKSTLLRMIAGLEIPDAGEILLTGQEATYLQARERNVGFVFQHYALFKHMNVWENVAFGLKMRKAGKEDIKSRIAELLKLVQLEGLEKRYPTQLSGGQRQRVAVARALAPQPQVLLLDEPFGALDAKVREELQEWITELHEKSHVTTLFVTHDQDEAMAIASDILVMNKGRIEQEGTPLEIFDHPATQFVAQFVGEANFVDSKVVEPELAIWGPFKYSVNGYEVGQKVRIYFRPNDVYVTSREESLQVKGKIIKTRFQGPIIELVIDVGGEKPIVAHLPKGLSIASGFVEGRQVFVGITGFHSFSDLMKYYDFEVRIAYSDTDRMGVIYYANYLVFFERGRTEFLRSLGLRYRDLEDRSGIYLPALDSHIQYLYPGRYDDLIKVRTFITGLGGAHIDFRYEITLADSNKLIATGSSRHAVVNRAWRPTRIPVELRKVLQAHLEK